MAHKNNEVLHTLMRALDDERNGIFIHMDAKKRMERKSLVGFCQKDGDLFNSSYQSHLGRVFANRL